MSSPPSPLATNARHEIAVALPGKAIQAGLEGHTGPFSNFSSAPGVIADLVWLAMILPPPGLVPTAPSSSPSVGKVPPPPAASALLFVLPLVGRGRLQHEAPHFCACANGKLLGCLFQLHVAKLSFCFAMDPQLWIKEVVFVPQSSCLLHSHRLPS